MHYSLMNPRGAPHVAGTINHGANDSHKAVVKGVVPINEKGAYIIVFSNPAAASLFRFSFRSPAVVLRFRFKVVPSTVGSAAAAVGGAASA